MAKIPASPVIRTIYAVSMFARYLFRQSHLIVIKAPYRRTYSLSLVIAAKTPVPSRRTDLTPCSTCFRGTNQRRSGQRILGERCAVEIQASTEVLLRALAFVRIHAAVNFARRVVP